MLQGNIFIALFHFAESVDPDSKMDEEVLEAASKLVPKAFLSTSKDAQESRAKVFRILLEQVPIHQRIVIVYLSFFMCLVSDV